jgi:hypothetical protein
MKLVMGALILALGLLSASGPALAQGNTTTADAPQRWIDVYNDSEQEIYYVYMREETTTEWGPDLLGDATIPVGETHRVDPVDSSTRCKFSLEIEFQDGTRLTSRSFNACEATEATVNNRRIRVR